MSRISCLHEMESDVFEFFAANDHCDARERISTISAYQIVHRQSPVVEIRPQRASFHRVAELKLRHDGGDAPALLVDSIPSAARRIGTWE